MFYVFCECYSWNKLNAPHCAFFPSLLLLLRSHVFVVVALLLSPLRCHLVCMLPSPSFALLTLSTSSLATYCFWGAKEFEFQEIFKNILHQGR